MADEPREAAESPGERLHGAVVAAYELDEHERALLVEAARTLDLCAALQDALDADGPLMATRAGVRAHPAAVELRAQRICLARLLAALGVPSGLEEGSAEPRPQRRAARGVYGLGAA